MKNNILIFLFAVVLILSGCGTPRKIQTNNSHNKELLTQESEKINRVVDTTTNKSGKISIIEIEFAGDPPKVESKDNPTNPDPPIIETDNVKITGPIKSAKITTIEEQEEKKGTTKEEIDKETFASNIEHEDFTQLEEPGKDPKRYKWIFYTALILVVMILIIKRSSLWGIIKKILHL